ncbi:hypothetical protein D6851_00595 [Altericroceibacterium spongiae]|uniref:Uncharacterized protein n=1 Tax=Altericroceibacterium spongiae TaxID=2320269 RepID=A0A420EQU3_9SPHN|nr:hypothetical protein [Altericroceibacterium spongiae]RKF23044.1 hypothetical protein D6851_00595 [Altericroceibacterium spongiae]
MIWAGPDIVTIMAIVVAAGWIVSHIVQANHLARLRHELDCLPRPHPKEKLARLAEENRHLSVTVAGLQDRIEVLEKVISDGSNQMADQIDRLPADRGEFGQ